MWYEDVDTHGAPQRLTLADVLLGVNLREQPREELDQLVLGVDSHADPETVLEVCNRVLEVVPDHLADKIAGRCLGRGVG